MKIKKSFLTLALVLLPITSSCDDATLAGKAKTTTPATTPAACSPCRIYVTTSNYLGNFGSAANGDNICATDANKPATGTYKAMVVDGTRIACTTSNCGGGSAEHTGWVLYPNTAYTQVGGLAIATTTANGIFTFPLTNNLGPAVANNAYTGIFMDWTSNSNCVSWTDSTNNSRIGSVATTSSSSISLTTQACNISRALICVEQ